MDVTRFVSARVISSPPTLIVARKPVNLLHRLAARGVNDKRPGSLAQQS
jgi:hypothetical protein